MKREQLGQELMKLVTGNDRSKICTWAYQTYINKINEIDSSEKQILEALFSMEDDPQFEYTFDELKRLASNLIRGDSDALEQINAPKKLDLFLYGLNLLIKDKVNSECLNKNKSYLKASVDILEIIKNQSNIYKVDSTIIDSIEQEIYKLKSIKNED